MTGYALSFLGCLAVLLWSLCRIASINLREEERR